jgi:hypothetical protein
VAQSNDCTIVIAIGLALLVICGVPFLLRLLLIARRSAVVPHRRTLTRLGTVLSCLTAILLGLRLVPRSIAAADHNLRHRRCGRNECRQSKCICGSHCNFLLQLLFV